ncbi:MAG: PIN domain-containing protein [Halobacteriaceae archaeon]
MTLVFDAEPLVALAFDEPGADAVQADLRAVYDGDRDAYVATVTLAELRYAAIRYDSAEAADRYVRRLADLGVEEFAVDDIWRAVADVKAAHPVSLGDAYAFCTAAALATGDGTGDVTLRVGSDGDFEKLAERGPDGLSIRPCLDREPD